MQLKNILLCITTILLCAGCGGFSNENDFTATPDFFTATLPPTLTPQAVQTSTRPAPVTSTVEGSNLSPVEGTTTTQLNVRMGPSTASESLGMIGPFVKAQVIGRDASGNWYQIIYAESEAGKGWVRAEYVQVNASAEIPLVETTSGSGSVVSGLVIQKINVRNGPGTEFELLGVLNSNDVVFITGRDANGAWIQIEFAGAPDEKGWVTAEFLQADIENVPRIGTATEETPTPIVEMPTVASARTAAQDGDSMQSPLAVTVFSATGSRALQVRSDISAPNGDTEDWIQFTAPGGVVTIHVTCSNNTLRVELWNNGKPVDNFSCGKQFMVQAAAGSNYFLRLIQNDAGYTSYILNLEVIP